MGPWTWDAGIVYTRVRVHVWSGVVPSVRRIEPLIDLVRYLSNWIGYLVEISYEKKFFILTIHRHG